MCEDTKLSPKITGRVDFTRSKMKLDFVEGDWSGDNATEQLGERIVANPAAFPEDPVCYSVIAGNRKIEKEYKFLIVERPLQ